MIWRLILLFLAPLLLFSPSTQAQDSAYVHTRRLWTGIAVAGVTNTAVLVGLNQLWYRQYPRSAFHWDNDWPNWKQQDKLGHFFTAMTLTRLSGKYLQWSGLELQKAALIGGVVGFVFQAQIEILDGFSAGWGASAGDLMANALGSTWGSLQLLSPTLNQHVQIKYSYHPSPYYERKLTLLGNLIKDYDGVTYWAFLYPPLSKWPAWIGIGIGHSAAGLAHPLPTPDAPHYREWFIGLDLDLLRHIRWPYPWMQTLAQWLSMVRIPAPALQLTPHVQWYWFYY